MEVATGICENCQQPIVEHGRNWIHTTGQYRCGPGHSSVGFASPADFKGKLDAAQDRGFERGFDAGKEEGIEECESRYDEGFVAAKQKCKTAIAELVTMDVSPGFFKAIRRCAKALEAVE